MKTYVSGDIFVMRPPQQTLKGWEPFWDCVGILFEFQNSDVDEEHTEWRIQWVAGISLLRAIGHVLAKCDARASEIHKREIDNIWKSWKNDTYDKKIFFEFIENERNNILKTYDFGAELAEDEYGHFVSYSNGDDAFQLFREAIYWWRHQLITIENRIAISTA